MSDLETIEARLKKQLNQLEKQRGEIEKKLRALEVVRKAAEEIESGDGDGGFADLEALADFPALPSAGPSQTNSAAKVQAEEEPEAAPAKAGPPEEPARKEPPPKEPPKEEPPKEEEEPVDTAQRNRRDLEASVVGVKLNPEDAVLEVLRVFKQPLKATKVAEELMAVNFPLGGDAKEVVKASLDNLEKEGLVKKSTSLRGVFYTLAEG